MAIDPSIALNAQAQQPNMLAQFGQIAQTGNALLQGRGLQQNLLAQQAQGLAIQRGIRPDGTYDPAAANQALAASGSAGAPGIQSAISGNQALTDAQQARGQAGQQQVNQTLTSLLTLPDAQMTGDTIRQSIAALQKNQAITPADAQGAEAQLPPDGSPPAAYRQYLTRHTVANLAGPQAVQQIYGSPVTISNGQSVQGGLQAGPLSQNPGALQPAGGAVQVYPPRSQLSERTVVGTDPQGNPIYGPLSTVTPPGLAGPAGSPSPLGTGRLPPSLLNPNKPQATPSPTASSAPGAPPAVGTVGSAENGGLVTEMGPVQTASRTAQATSSQAAFQNIAEQGQQAQQQAAVLGNMLGDTKLFTPGQTDLNNVKGSIEKYAPSLAPTLGITPESVAANESFDKLANQIAGAQGAGSDARLLVAQGANPSSHLSKAGADMIVRQLQGNADYLQARAKLATTADQTNRPAFESGIAANLDPRAFQFARMTPAQKVTYDKNLSDQDRAKVRAAYGFGVQNNLIAPQ